MQLERPPAFSYPIKEEEIDLTRLLVPAPVTLKFNRMIIRLHNDQDLDGFVFLTTAIPQYRDSEGFVWEMEFGFEFQEYEPSHGYQTNSFPKEAFSLQDFLNLLHVKLEYEPHAHLPKKGNLMLKASVAGTSFRGRLDLEKEMFAVDEE